MPLKILKSARGDSVSEPAGRTNKDPGARGGALGLRLRSTKKAERCKRARMVKKVDGRDVIVEPLNAWARLLVGQCGEPRGAG
jgi:hypothetical protein